MELWIRSQDKKRLYNVNELFIEKDIYKDWCIETAIGTDYILKDAWYICVNQSRLGRYFSEQRALEVLDEIQNMLNPMIVFKNCNCTKDMLDNIKEVGACVVSDNSHIEQLSTCVYEMPKE